MILESRLPVPRYFLNISLPHERVTATEPHRKKIEEPTRTEAIPTVAALQAQLAGWDGGPADIVDRLLRDQHAATPPTPLQRWAYQLLHRTVETRPDRA